MIILVVPFLSAIHTLGKGTFLESFENPEQYVLLQQNNKYIIVQKSSHPNFNIKLGDTLFYYNNTGKLISKKIYQIRTINPINKYYTLYIFNDEDQPISKEQLVGKIIKKTDTGLANKISMNLWDLSVHTLNIRALITS